MRIPRLSVPTAPIFTPKAESLHQQAGAIQSSGVRNAVPLRLGRLRISRPHVDPGLKTGILTSSERES